MRLLAFSILAMLTAGSGADLTTTHGDGQPPASQATDLAETWATRPTGTMLRPCRIGSPDMTRAQRQLDRLSARIDRLGLDEASGPIVAELHALLAGPCFQLAQEIGDVPAPASAVALKTWWHDGGRAWLESYLEMPRRVVHGQSRSHVVVPPSVRQALNSATSPAHPLRGLLCPPGDEACGASTRECRRRAERYFTEHPADLPWPNEPSELQTSDAVAESCSTEVPDAAADRRYGHWRACIDERTKEHAALPLGEFRAPSSGWLLIVGRRGHYSFCDTTRAYNLESGAALMYDRCRAFGQRPGPLMNQGAPDTSPTIAATAGRLPLDLLREATWMLAFEPVVERVRLHASYALPDTILRRLTVSGEMGVRSVIAWGSSGQTTLSWFWLRPGEAVVGGEVTWPSSARASETYAATLLDNVEKQFEAGCAPASPPAIVDLPHTVAGAGGRVFRSTTDEQASFAREWATAVERWAVLPSCTQSGAPR
jgi:hypothetical protein